MLSEDHIIYFDHGATSWPKPAGVLEGMRAFMEQVGASPGRSGHRLAFEAGRMVLQTRLNLAELFNLDNPDRVIFSKNATESLNQAIFGLLKAGDRVITSSLEHNSVMRPLRILEERQEIDLVIVQGNAKGILDIEMLQKELKKTTRLVVLTHASNVSGAVNSIEEIGQIVKEAGALFLVDAAQTAGALPIDIQSAKIDFLAFTGHKSLFGPTGTGGLLINTNEILHPVSFGGTGSFSENEFQPDFYPDALESGTLNSIGIAGLKSATDFILSKSVETIRQHDQTLTRSLLEGLRTIEGLSIHGPADAELQVSLVSINVPGYTPAEIGQILDEEYGIMTRVGLHCAPSAHKTLCTFPHGTVRLSMSYMNSLEEVKQTIFALQEIVRRKK